MISCSWVNHSLAILMNVNYWAWLQLCPVWSKVAGNCFLRNRLEKLWVAWLPEYIFSQCFLLLLYFWTLFFFLFFFSLHPMPSSNLPHLKKLQMILSLSPVCICIVVQSGLASQPLLFCNKRWQSTAPLNRAIPETLDPELPLAWWRWKFRVC